jgi:hypothetical protein
MTVVDEFDLAKPALTFSNISMKNQSPTSSSLSHRGYVYGQGYPVIREKLHQD